MTAPSTPDLAARILAAIDETERIAMAASYWPDDEECGTGTFVTFEHGSWARRFVDEQEMTNAVVTDEGARTHSVAIVNSVGDTQMPVYLSRHIARNDPETIRRRCAADRRLVQRHQREVEPNRWFQTGDDGSGEYRDVEYCVPCTIGRGCDHCISWTGTSMIDEGPALWPCDTIRDRAEAYGITVEAP